MRSIQIEFNREKRAMNFFEKIEHIQNKNNSFLCIGLDIDLEKIPPHLHNCNDPIFEFNKSIIDATKDLVCAYKPNLAFYEQYGMKGLEALIKTIKYISSQIPIIADAKRGDIGTTSKAYAKAIFEELSCDATTVNPYLGHDSFVPFLSYKDKGIFILCLTSNEGAKDFQMPNHLYLKVAQSIKEWNMNNNCGLVVGATYPEQLKEIRNIAGDLPFLVPGIGKQGGDVTATVGYGMNSKKRGLIINASRSVIYASNDKNFSECARKEALRLNDLINKVREEFNLL